jgi:hypothetical protein
LRHADGLPGPDSACSEGGGMKVKKQTPVRRGRKGFAEDAEGDTTMEKREIDQMDVFRVLCVIFATSAYGCPLSGA